MYQFLNAYTLLFVPVALVLFGLAVAAARHRNTRAAVPFAVFSLATGLWALGDGLRIAAPDPAQILFWNKFAYVGITLIPVSYVLFIAALTNRERWFRRRRVLALSLVSIAALGLVLTNSLHGLWRVRTPVATTFSPGTAPPVIQEVHGPAWYLWAVYSYAIVLAGLYFLLREFLQKGRSRLYRTQILLVLAGVAVPTASNLLFIFRVLSFDPAPITFALTGVAFSTAMFRHRLLEIAPIARDVVVESLDSGVLVLDPNDTVVDANALAHEVFDLDTRDVPGIDLSTALSGSPNLVGGFEDLQEGSQTITADTDGERRHYGVDVSPVRDPLDTYLGRVILFTDVTSEVRRERELERRTAELERQNERLDDFASVVSHDLRNPIEIAQGYLDTARETGDPAHFEEIDDALDRMERIVGDVLVLARQGDAIDDVERVAVAAVAKTAWGSVDTAESELRLGGVTDGGESLPPDGGEPRPARGSSPAGDWSLRADPARLRRVFENLFRNAVEHNDDPVTVTVGPLDAGGFYVEDDGDGIPPERRDRVLDRGFSTRPEGTGLGLAIVREIAEAHGWRLRVSDPSTSTGTGTGARFEIVTD